MQKKSKNTWFPAKKNGWGWGKPTAWQGWAVLVVYFAVIGVISVSYDPKVTLKEWGVGVGVATVILLLIYWLKGEPPSWTWKRIDKKKKRLFK
ncbi:hypothetical protein MSP8887_00675 [Marinomonas spartinae]|uniref:hypothetical protein n=1 Tax=Marinomonas spartinae TaxID=1792290 RepID=UPI000808AB12|nr:hypothetical protein [Marinomonas spartinae]SBS27551.1 hypothetical protein MSP8887_00675 [Marinomonas spartinae]